MSCQICVVTDADINQIVKGIGYAEYLLPVHTIKPGPMIGGSCLHKDTNALVQMSKDIGYKLHMVEAAIKSNEKHVREIINSIHNILDFDIKNKHIAIWGLSFKANTDDIRNSPAIPIIDQLLQDGALINAYDPCAMENLNRLFPQINYCLDIDDSIKDADLLIVLTGWEEFKLYSLAKIAETMSYPLVMDCKNLFDPAQLEKYNIAYVNLGRK